MTQSRVVHIVGDLNGFGGTESTLLRYLKTSRAGNRRHSVVVLRSAGVGDTIGAQIVEAGFPVIELHQRSGSSSSRTIWALWKVLKVLKPDVISAWLYHPSLLSCLLSPLLSKTAKQVWHIRSLPNARGVRPWNKAIQKTLALLSRRSQATLATNSLASMEAHVAIGFRKTGWKLIANGLDTELYRSAPVARARIRGELGFPHDAIVLGCIGRWVPEKGYDILFRALESLQSQLPESVFRRLYLLGVGAHVTHSNADFLRMATRALPGERLRLLGKRSDVPGLLQALDLFVLSSVSESFPNSLVEAMASALPCVATNTGGVGELEIDQSLLALPGNAPSLSVALLNGLSLSVDAAARMGRSNRLLVKERYSLSNMTQTLDSLLLDT